MCEFKTLYILKTPYFLLFIKQDKYKYQVLLKAKVSLSVSEWINIDAFLTVKWPILDLTVLDVFIYETVLFFMYFAGEKFTLSKILPM